MGTLPTVTQHLDWLANKKHRKHILRSLISSIDKYERTFTDFVYHYLTMRESVNKLKDIRQEYLYSGTQLHYERKLSPFLIGKICAGKQALGIDPDPYVPLLAHHHIIRVNSTAQTITAYAMSSEHQSIVPGITSIKNPHLNLAQLLEERLNQLAGLPHFDDMLQVVQQRREEMAKKYSANAQQKAPV